MTLLFFDNCIINMTDVVLIEKSEEGSHITFRNGSYVDVPKSLDEIWQAFENRFGAVRK